MTTSTSETGHAKNVANFEALIAFCKGYGSDYQPTDSNQEIKSMQILCDKANASITLVNQMLKPYSKAVEEREIAFNPLSKLTTRVISALAASKVSQQAIDNAHTHASKIKGVRIGKKAKPTIDPNNPDAKAIDNSISVSQLSYNSKVDNLEKLIESLKGEPKYVPNETELKISTLEELLNNLKVKNLAVLDATQPLSNARINRNSVLYNSNDGLVIIAKDVKNYVKSIYSPTHPKYKQISGLAFKQVND